ncbi:MAG: hypothetical protein IH627_12395 [Rubrivivax sp.]|nr:hypothetical protein [Rubrivivax sp.]
MTTSEMNGEIEDVLALLAYAEVLNGPQAAGLVAELLCYVLESAPSATTRVVVAAMLDATAELMKREGLL